ncbi:MAG: enoyl-CoA hydratase-related protein [Myxococcaceae bacterium]
MNDSGVSLTWEGDIGLLTVDRPSALNALNSAALAGVLAAAEAAARRPGARGLIVTGAGAKAFVAGADVQEMADFSPEQARRFSELGHRAFARLEALPFPTVAAINGFALGGGLELALGCDLLYAADNAKLGFPEVTLAVIPGFGGTQRLSRRVGVQRAKELLFVAEPISAARAKEIGLVLDVVPQAELLTHVRAVLAKILQRGPLAIAQVKRMVEDGQDLPLAQANAMEQQAFGLMFGTADQREGMSAFLAKRPPRYQGH